MKKAYFFLISVSLFLVAVISSFQQSPGNQPMPKERLAKQLSEDVNLLLGQMTLAADQWEEVRSGKRDINAYRKEFSKLRLAYKKVEFLAEYFEPNLIKLNINGAPLPKLNLGTESMMVVEEPNGLQTLDELIFSDEYVQEQNKISDLLAKLRNEMSWFRGFQRQVLTDREIFEAVRLSLIRTFTLGLTGFDCPGSVNSIEEAKTVLLSLQNAVTMYLPYTSKGFSSKSKKLSSTFASAIKYLESHPGFDELDRMHVLTNFINPLYTLVLDLHLELGIEFKNPRHALLQPWNYSSKNLFDENLLNKYYYTGLAQRTNRDTLAKLGKLLFFDPVLSASNDRSCASCHHPSKAFTDGMAKSLATGMQGTVDRNSPTCIDAVFADRFFYDLRTDVLEDQIEHVVHSSKEFNTNYAELSRKLGQSPEYKAMFRGAFPEFGEDPINESSIASALAAYVASLTSYNSSVDKYIRGEQKDLSAEVKKGFNLFMGKAACGTCHFAPVFNGLVPPTFLESESEVLGVPATTDTLKPLIDPDPGRVAAKVKERVDIYLHSFKTPTVRNTALTAPYMHNGVYKSLEEVMDFYNKGGGVGLGITLPNQTLPPDPLGLNQGEIKAIISFMKALSDTSGLTDVPTRLPLFSETSLNNRKIGGNY